VKQKIEIGAAHFEIFVLTADLQKTENIGKRINLQTEIPLFAFYKAAGHLRIFEIFLLLK
jgi:hypothetical protein